MPEPKKDYSMWKTLFNMSFRAPYSFYSRAARGIYGEDAKKAAKESAWDSIIYNIFLVLCFVLIILSPYIVDYISKIDFATLLMSDFPIP
jgi:hypothetical protein